MMKILLVEDLQDHRELIEEHLFQAFHGDVIFQWEKTFSGGCQQIADQIFDIALFDLTLPDSSYDETIQKLQYIKSKTPIVVLSSNDSTTMAQMLVRQGIQDYLPKSLMSAELLQRVCLYAIERKNNQLALEEHNMDMQTFCRIISHDFKGTLHRITQFTKILKEDLNDRIHLTNENKEWFQLLENSTMDARLLLTDLHSYLYVNSGISDFQAVDLHALFVRIDDQLKDIMSKKYRLHLSSLLTIDGNEAQLFILFKNLVENGIKYNNESPEIHVDCEIDTSTKKCQITIRDNGIGMEEQNISMIFTPFKRLQKMEDYPGYGLGLSIVKRIVGNHKGEIEVESEVGKGSRFIVTLPIIAK